MDSDSDLEEDLIPQNLRNLKLKTNAFSSQSQFSQSQRVGWPGSSSQRGSTSARSSHDNRAQSHYTSQLQHASKNPRLSLSRPKNLPQKMEEQGSGSTSEGAGTATGRGMPITILSSPEQPVMLSLGSSKSRRGAGPTRAGSSAETISETDLSSGDGEDKSKTRNREPKTLVSSVATASTAAAFSVPARTVNRSTASSEPSLSKPTTTSSLPTRKILPAPSRYKIPSAWQIASSDSDDTDSEDAGMDPLPGRTVPVEKKQGVVVGSEARPLAVPLMEDEEDLTLPVLAYSSRQRRSADTQSQKTQLGACTVSSGAGGTVSARDKSAHRAPSNPSAGSVRRTKNKSHSRDSGSSDADIESVDSSSEGERDSCSRPRHRDHSAGSSKPSCATASQGRSSALKAEPVGGVATVEKKARGADGVVTWGVGGRTVTLEDSSLEHSQFSPSILQQDTQVVLSSSGKTSGAIQGGVKTEIVDGLGSVLVSEVKSLDPNQFWSPEVKKMEVKAWAVGGGGLSRDASRSSSSTLEAGAMDLSRHSTLTFDSDVTLPCEASDYQSLVVLPPPPPTLHSMPSALQRQESAQSDVTLPCEASDYYQSPNAAPPPTLHRIPSALQRQESAQSDVTLPCEASDYHQSLTSPPPPTLHSIASIPSTLQRQGSGPSLQPPLLTKRSSSLVLGSTCSAGSISDSHNWPALTASALATVKSEKVAFGTVTVPDTSQTDSPVYGIIKKERVDPERVFSVTVQLPGGVDRQGEATVGAGGVEPESLTISVRMPPGLQGQSAAVAHVKKEAGDNTSSTASIASRTVVPKKEEPQESNVVVQQHAMTPPAQVDHDDDGGSNDSQCLFQDLPARSLSATAAQQAIQAAATQDMDVYLSDAEGDPPPHGRPEASGVVESFQSNQQNQLPVSVSEMPLSISVQWPGGQQAVFKQEKLEEGEDDVMGVGQTAGDNVGYTLEDDTVVVFDSEDEEMFTSFTQVMVKDEEPSDDEGDSLWHEDDLGDQSLSGRLPGGAGSDDDEEDTGDGLDGGIHGNNALGRADGSDPDTAMDSADDEDLVSATEELERLPEEKSSLLDNDAGVMSDVSDSVYQIDTQIDDDDTEAVAKASESSSKRDDVKAAKAGKIQKGGSREDSNEDSFADDINYDLFMAVTQKDDGQEFNIRGGDSSRHVKTLTSESRAAEFSDGMDDALSEAASQAELSEAHVDLCSRKSDSLLPQKQRPSSSADDSSVDGRFTSRQTARKSFRDNALSEAASQAELSETRVDLCLRKSDSLLPQKQRPSSSGDDSSVDGQFTSRQTARKSFRDKHAGKRTARKSMRARCDSKPQQRVEQRPQERAKAEPLVSKPMFLQKMDVISSQISHFGSKRPAFSGHVDVDLTLESSEDMTKDSDSDCDDINFIAENKVNLFDCATLAVEEENPIPSDSDSDDGKTIAEKIRERTNSFDKFSAPTLAMGDRMNSEEEEEEEVDVFAMATQKDFDPYQMATQKDRWSGSDSDSNLDEVHVSEAEVSEADDKGDAGRRSGSDSDMLSDTNLAASPPRVGDRKGTDSGESSSQSDLDVSSVEETEDVVSVEKERERSTTPGSKHNSTASMTKIRSGDLSSGGTPSKHKDFETAKATMTKINVKNAFTGTLPCSPRPEARRKGKRVGLKQKLCHGEDTAPVPRTDPMQQRGISSSSDASAAAAAPVPAPKGILRSVSTEQLFSAPKGILRSVSTEQLSSAPKGILRSASTEQQSSSALKGVNRSVAVEQEFSISNAASSSTWLSKKPDFAAPKKVPSKPRKRGRGGPLSPDLSAMTKRARQQVAERQQKVFTHPELTAHHRPRVVSAPADPDLNTDVVMPDTQEIFDIGLPLLKPGRLIPKERLMKGRDKSSAVRGGSGHSSSASSTGSALSLSAAEPESRPPSSSASSDATAAEYSCALPQQRDSGPAEKAGERVRSKPEEKGKARIQHHKEEGPRTQHHKEEGPRTQHHKEEGPRTKHHKEEGPRTKHHKEEGPRTQHHKEKGPRTERHKEKGPRTERHKEKGPRTERHKEKGPRTERHEEEGPRTEHHKEEGPRTEHHKEEGPRTEHHKEKGPRTQHHKDKGPRTERHKEKGPRTERHEEEGPRTEHHKEEGPRTQHHKEEGPRTQHHKEEGPRTQHHKEEGPRTQHHKEEGPRTQHHKEEGKKPSCSREDKDKTRPDSSKKKHSSGESQSKDIKQTDRKHRKESSRKEDDGDKPEQSRLSASLPSSSSSKGEKPHHEHRRSSGSSQVSSASSSSSTARHQEQPSKRDTSHRQSLEKHQPAETRKSSEAKVETGHKRRRKSSEDQSRGLATRCTEESSSAKQRRSSAENPRCEGGPSTESLRSSATALSDIVSRKRLEAQHRRTSKSHDKQTPELHCKQASESLRKRMPEKHHKHLASKRPSTERNVFDSLLSGLSAAGDSGCGPTTGARDSGASPRNDGDGRSLFESVDSESEKNLRRKNKEKEDSIQAEKHEKKREHKPRDKSREERDAKPSGSHTKGPVHDRELEGKKHDRQNEQDNLKQSNARHKVKQSQPDSSNNEELAHKKSKKKHSSDESQRKDVKQTDRKHRKDGSRQKEDCRDKPEKSKSSTSLPSSSKGEKPHHKSRHSSGSSHGSSASSTAPERSPKYMSKSSSETKPKESSKHSPAPSSTRSEKGHKDPPVASHSHPSSALVQSAPARKHTETHTSGVPPPPPQARVASTSGTAAPKNSPSHERFRPPTPPRKTDRSATESHAKNVPSSSASSSKSKTVRFNPDIQYRYIPPPGTLNPTTTTSTHTQGFLPRSKPPPSSSSSSQRAPSLFVGGHPLAKRLPPQLEHQQLQWQQQQLKVQLEQMQQKQKRQAQQSTIPTYVFKPIVVDKYDEGENARPGQTLLGPDELVMHILQKWNPNWLAEHERELQRAENSKGALVVLPPPIVNPDQLYPLLPSYDDNIFEYQQICFKLLLLETWEDVFRCWKERQQKSPIGPWHVFHTETTRLRQSAMISLGWTGFLTEHEAQRGLYPLEGDLVVVNMVGFNLPGSNSQQPSQGPSQGRKVKVAQLAYVERSNVTRGQDVAKLVFKNPHFKEHPALKRKEKNVFLFKLMLKMRYCKFVPDHKSQMTVNPVGSLTSAQRRFNALQMLPRCPLMRDVLSLSPAAAGCGIRVPEKLIRFVQNGRTTLNLDQSLAVRTVFAAVMDQPPTVPRISLLWGPPGTGKSHVIVALIFRILEGNRNAKICLAAPSNAAADELLRRLAKKSMDINQRLNRSQQRQNTVMKVDMVRIGKADSFHSDVTRFSLETKIQRAKEEALRLKRLQKVPQTVRSAHDSLQGKLQNMAQEITSLKIMRKYEESQMVERDMKKEQKRLTVLTMQINKGQEGVSLSPAEYVAVYAKELKDVFLSPAEYAAVYAKELKDPQIVCGTLSSFGHPRVVNALCRNPSDNRRNYSHFTCAIIDEATQATELDSLIPLQYGLTKLFMVGDHNQLPPTVLSTKAMSLNYNQSLFERLFKHLQDGRHGNSSVMMLKTQYRMDPAICRFPNKHVYAGSLHTDEKVVLDCQKYALQPYIIFDVEESQELQSQSGTLSNEMEADCTAILCQLLTDNHLKIVPEHIGIICPYAGQKRLVKKKMEERHIKGIEVNTVDGFQGREKHIIILSCVRAKSSSGGIGFMADTRRMNVALTRAKYALYIIGHFQSLQTDRDWEALFRDARERGEGVSVQRVDSLEHFPRIVHQSCFKASYRPRGPPPSTHTKGPHSW